MGIETAMGYDLYAKLQLLDVGFHDRWQSGQLLSAPPLDNIRFGRPDASMAEVVAAAQAIGARDLIASFPDGPDTDVHQKKARLSSGQRRAKVVATPPSTMPGWRLLSDG